MYPDIGREDVDAIETPAIGSPDDHVVDLSVRAGVQSKVERRRVDQGNVMEREVRALVAAQQTRTV